MKAPADDIPRCVAELFAAEREAPRPSLAIERRVHGRLAITLAIAGTASLAASPAAAATAAGVSAKAGGLALGIKLSLVAVSVGVVGSAGGMVWRH